MSKLTWNESSTRLFETGVDRVVVYPPSGDGFAWSGVSDITESANSDTQDYYMDGTKHQISIAGQDYSATLGSYSVPKQFRDLIGEPGTTKGLYFTGQKRKTFGLSYRTLIGNDTQATDYGYKIHLVYNAYATSSDKAYKTLDDSPDAIQLTHGIVTKPSFITGRRPTAHLIIESPDADAEALAVLEGMLYGTDTTVPHMPSLNALFTIFGDV